jgi:hypothetical protein
MTHDNFNLEQIYNEIEAIEVDLLNLKKRKSELEYEVANYFEDEFNQKLSQKPDKCGTVTINLDDFDVKYNVRKAVKWDQEKLDKLYSEIAKHEDPKQYMNIKYGVHESSYKSWPDKIKKAFEPARTMSHGGGKLTIVRKDD